MKRIIFLSLVFAGIDGLTATAQRLNEGNISSASGSFILRSVAVKSVLKKETVLATPDWSPKDPLPLSISNAIVIAETELNRYATFEPVSYEVKSVWLRAYSGTQNKKWYFVISFQRTPDLAKNDPYILVDFAGHVGALEPEDRALKLQLK